jgi:hypothetical protein
LSGNKALKVSDLACLLNLFLSTALPARFPTLKATPGSPLKRYLKEIFLVLNLQALEKILLICFEVNEYFNRLP